MPAAPQCGAKGQTSQGSLPINTAGMNKDGDAELNATFKHYQTPGLGQKCFKAPFIVERKAAGHRFFHHDTVDACVCM